MVDPARTQAVVRGQGTSVVQEEDDRGLLGKWLYGRDEAALQELLDRHRATIRRVCFRILRDHGEAEDATQDVSIAVMRLDGMIEGDYLAWVRGCAAKAALQYRRARLRRWRREQRTVVAHGHRDGDLLVLVDECVESLSEADRQLVVDYFYLDHTQAEIAAAHGVSQVAVHKRLRAVLARLQALMRRRGARLGALAVLAALLGGPAAAQAAAVELGLRTARRLAIVTVAALGLACLGMLAVGLHARGEPAMALPAVSAASVPVAPRPAPAIPSRLVLADGELDGGSWRFDVRRERIVDRSPTVYSLHAPFTEVPVGWEGRIEGLMGDFLGAQAAMVELRGAADLCLVVRSARRAPAGVPYAFRLEYWESGGSGWRRAVGRSCLAWRDGVPAAYLAFRHYDADGRMVQLAPVREPDPRIRPTSFANDGISYSVVGTVRIRAPSLRLMDWDETLELIREIDPQATALPLAPILVADGAVTSFAFSD